MPAGVRPASVFAFLDMGERADVRGSRLPGREGRDARRKRFSSLSASAFVG